MVFPHDFVVDARCRRGTRRVGGPGVTGAARRLSWSVSEPLGPRGYLINIAQGNDFDQDVLVQLLVASAIGGAGLDVFADEPQVTAALLPKNNVVLTPHLASGTVPRGARSGHHGRDRVLASRNASQGGLAPAMVAEQAISERPHSAGEPPNRCCAACLVIPRSAPICSHV